MRIVGLIKEYDQNVTSKSYNDYQKNCLYNNKQEILNYLKNGESVAVTMSVVRSLAINDNSIIGGISYMTDGYWIWPSYIIYYFEKQSIELPSEFIEHISNKKMPSVGEIDTIEVVNFLKKHM